MTVYTSLWADMLKVEGRELFYSYMVDNQVILILETLDAVRALTELETDPQASIQKASDTLGITSQLLGERLEPHCSVGNTPALIR